ncbi:MAG: phosphotransferase [Hyphomicrobiales bacterium]
MAVYTHIDDDTLAEFIASHNVSAPTSFKGIAEGLENTSYLVQTTHDRFILTFYEKHAFRGALPFFLGLMDHLAQRGIACPTPVRGRPGRALRELNSC